jgi:hypothetical protein
MRTPGCRTILLLQFVPFNLNNTLQVTVRYLRAFTVVVLALVCHGMKGTNTLQQDYEYASAHFYVDSQMI